MDDTTKLKQKTLELIVEKRDNEEMRQELNIKNRKLKKELKELKKQLKEMEEDNFELRQELNKYPQENCW
jgi:Trm5-related predicted tRNA methylase|tara:strand:+ start:121 stop:330 length:210 start_codon:yes stop_codon:yes gene_type:complete